MADKRISQLTDRGTVANNDVVAIVVNGAVTTNKATISSIQTFMQGNLDLGVTSVGITLGSSGTDVSVTGSPITTSGNITIDIPTASAVNRGVLSAADFITFNSKQPAGNYVTLDTAQTITAQKLFTGGGSSDSVIISHGSGSGLALDVIKAGNGDVIRVLKTSGSGNAMTVQGGIFEAPTIVKTGGTSSQFLKADGSVDSSTYLTTGTAGSTYVPYSGATGSVNLGVYNIAANAINSTGSGSIAGQINLRSDTVNSLLNGYGSITSNTSNAFIFYQTTAAGVFRGAILSLNSITESATRTYTLPDASGTLALSADLGAYLPLAGGTLTGALNGTSAVFSGDVGVVKSSPANYLQNSTSITTGTRGDLAWYNSSVSTVALIRASAITDNVGTSLDFFTRPAAGSLTQVLTLASTGNVGIGTATPTDFGSTYKVLSIDGAGGGGVLDLMNGGTRSLTLGVDASEPSISSRINGNPIVFRTNSGGTVAERMRITSGGDLQLTSGVAAFFRSGKKIELNPNVSFLNVDAEIEVTSGMNLFFKLGGSERLRITSGGVVQPGADNTQTLGSASFRWSEVFAGNATINTSDATEKQDIEELNEAEQEVAKALKGLIRKYRWIDSVKRKGEEARIHVGVMAQDVAQAFSDNGLDAERYGVFCKDVWYTKEKTYTEQIDNLEFNEELEEGEGNLRTIEGDEKIRTVNCDKEDLDATEHTLMGVRYDQLWAFIISAL